MTKLYEGKTKDVFKLDDGNIKLFFKDDVTGENGKFDPGANTVGLKIDGAGNAGLKMSKHYFELIEANGNPTHYISSDLAENTMVVKSATPFGKGLEIICRFKAFGSFIKRYGLYSKAGDKLDAYVEVTLKDDARQDPLITKEGLIALNILKDGEYEILENLTKNISKIIKDDLEKKGLELYDIKLEFGRDVAGNILLIDEVSGGNMRVFKNDTYVLPLELTNLVV